MRLGSAHLEILFKWKLFIKLCCELILFRKAFRNIKMIYLFEVWNQDRSLFHSRRSDSMQGLSADLSPDQSIVAVGCTNGKVILFRVSLYSGNPYHIKCYTYFAETIMFFCVMILTT